MIKGCNFGTVLAVILYAGPAPAGLKTSDLNGYSRRIWQMQDGLPRDTVHSLAQTKDRYLWIGTIGGLARFDGARFTMYDRSNTPALLDDNILSLCATAEGDLWIGTVRGGLVEFSNGGFRRLE